VPPSGPIFYVETLTPTVTAWRTSNFNFILVCWITSTLRTHSN